MPFAGAKAASRHASRVILGAGTVAFVAAATVLLAACPGSLENIEDFEDAGGCGDVPTKLIGPRCATANCHDADMPQSNVDMTPDDGLVARLVGVAGDQCTGMLIDPSAPDQSLMYTKCLENPTCGAQMPFTGAKFTPEEEQCLLDWVTSVAAQ